MKSFFLGERYNGGTIVVFQIRILRIWVTQMLAALILAKTEEGHQQEQRFGSIWINQCKDKTRKHGDNRGWSAREHRCRRLFVFPWKVVVEYWSRFGWNLRNKRKGRPSSCVPTSKAMDPLPPKMCLDNQRWKRSTSNWIWRYVFHILHIYIYIYIHTHTHWISNRFWCV